MTNKSNWKDIRDQIFIEQEKKCIICGRAFESHCYMHAHHSVYTRNKKFSKYLDSRENITLMCSKCHSTLHGHLTGWTRRNIFYQDKIAKGYDMRTWNNALKEAGMVTDYFIDTSGGN